MKHSFSSCKNLGVNKFEICLYFSSTFLLIGYMLGYPEYHIVPYFEKFCHLWYFRIKKNLRTDYSNFPIAKTKNYFTLSTVKSKI